MMFTIPLSLLLFASPQDPSVKDLLDKHLSDIRIRQNEDGSYGRNIDDTANALIAFACSPRAYREDDGPFIQRAVNNILRGIGTLESDKIRDLRIAFALESIQAKRYSMTIEKLIGPWNIQKKTIERLVFSTIDPQHPTKFLKNAQDLSFSKRLEACALTAVSWQRKTAYAKPAMLAYDEIYESGVDFLVSNLGESGLWEMMGAPEPGISALAAKALLGSKRKDIQNLAIPVLDYLITLQRKDGSITNGNLPVYVTSVAIMALKAGNRNADKKAIEQATLYLKTAQADETEGYSETDKFYGGIGYGSDLRPDLSNLQYALQALHETGTEANDPAFQKAITFLQRCQNRKESNPFSYRSTDGLEIESGDDGGGTYYPGNSPAGYKDTLNGKQQALSYGSMTYALLKCYLFAGLPQNDPRVLAALEWISNHWTLEVNPGFDALKAPEAGYMGLYYYYLTVAEALSIAGIAHLETTNAKKHNWRLEMLEKLASLQHQNGSWVNEKASRWWEGNPLLCTGYALNTLQIIKQ